MKTKKDESCESCDSGDATCCKDGGACGCGKVEDFINKMLEHEGAMLFALIDPPDHKDVESAVKCAVDSAEGGADVILIGGSTGVQGQLLDEVTKRVKEKVSAPVVLFPGNIGTVTRYADAIYFMSLLNSRNPYWITQAQMLAAPTVKQMGIEALPVGYIVVEPGGTVGWVGDVNLIPRTKPQLAAALALAAQYSGSRFVITDTGSAPADGPVPVEMIKVVASVLDIPYIVAGGIRTPDQAGKIIAAGADIIQVGTALEKSTDVKKTIASLVKAVKAEGKKRA
jgi:phosphoglycerol geranylgeranyltransferase